MLTKLCKTCDTDKLVAEFAVDRRRKDGLCSECKLCSNARKTKWKTNNKKKVFDSARNTLLKKRYGITPSQYEEMLLIQNGRCANLACNKHKDETSRGLHIDHDHISGAVRGLLCMNCNTSLGLLGDDPSIISGLLGYLNSFKRPELTNK